MLSLPILERWDCHHCTACCRETTIQLTAQDLVELRNQRWDQHPEFRGVPVTRRSSWLSGSPVLAHKEDGSCVFLTVEGMCRIHEQFGPDAKPAMCQQFPLTTVRTDRQEFFTVLRSCPSAAADRGRPLREHQSEYRRQHGKGSSAPTPPAVPPIVRGAQPSWNDFHRVAGALQRLVTDERFPLIRRLVHAVRFASLLDACRWRRVAEEARHELIELLEQSARDNCGPLFQDRPPPTRATARLFRRLGAHFIRCVPGGRPTRTVADHWRAMRYSGQVARAQDQLPALHPAFPSIASNMLERPLGPLVEEVLQPLTHLIESHAHSSRYALTHPTLPLTTGIRRLVFLHPIALWMLRWRTTDRAPTTDDMVQIVVALERGMALTALDRAVGYMNEADQLERLVAWYGR
jgi:lysine-N-methylase